MSKVSHDSETPAHGQQVITVCGFIHKKEDGINRVLLAQRASTKKFLPNLYEMPGGHVDFGEDIVDAVIREVKEEFNVTVTVGDPFACFTYQNLVKQSHSVEVIYFASLSESEQNIRINPEDHSNYKWFSEDEIHTIVIPNREIARREDSVKKKTNEDFEVRSILKGFSILNNQPLNLS